MHVNLNKNTVPKPYFVNEDENLSNESAVKNNPVPTPSPMYSQRSDITWSPERNDIMALVNQSIQTAELSMRSTEANAKKNAGSQWEADSHLFRNYFELFLKIVKNEKKMDMTYCMK